MAEILVEHQHGSLSLDPATCRRVLALVIEGEQASLEALTVVFADHDTVHELNRRYLDHDFRTDVLAFAFAEEEGVVDGEIYVDLDTASERHAEFGAGYEEEALRYAVHGLLHLIGYGDKTEEGRREMRELEDAYLRRAGIRGR